MRPFDSIPSHGCIRVAACAPRVEVANPAANVRATVEFARRAAACNAVLPVFPKLGLCAYANEDLALQDALIGVPRAMRPNIARIPPRES